MNTSKQPVSADDAQRLIEAVKVANIPTLLMVLIQMTGDLKWLEEPYCPRRARGLDDNDSGGLPEDIQTEIRDAAAEAILAWRDGQPLALPEPKPEFLARMLSVSMVEEVPDNYGENIAAGLGIGPNARRPKPLNAPKGFHVLIVGAGVSGICAGIRLQQAGVSFEIHDKDESVGGTWYENRYPGCGVDTPSHIYSFSFARNDWKQYFSLRDELYAYFRSVAENHGLMPHIHLHNKVETCRWDDTTQEWEVTISQKDGTKCTRRANVVISGVGVLNIPLTPEIKGLDTFTGVAFHTAEWPDHLDLKGKRVAVVGNGATAMQIVPAIVDETSHLTIFARSKQWAAPFPQFRQRLPEPVRYILQEVPLYHAWYRQRLAWTFNDRIHPTLQKDPEWPHPERSLNAVNDRHREQFIDYVKAELGERQDLLDKVVPDFPPFGKRMLLDNGWYRTISRPDVRLVAEHLAQVQGNTLIAADGSEHSVDVLILATGFKAAEILSSMNVIGNNGQSIRDVWDGDNARAYLGTTVAGFPNLFTLLGPNVGLGHGGSIIGSIENQMDYVMSALEHMFENNAAEIEVRQDVYDDYNTRVDAAHEKMVWTHKGMSNWYRNSRGRVVAITPWRNDDFWRMTRRANPEDYILTPSHNQIAGTSYTKTGS